MHVERFCGNRAITARVKIKNLGYKALQVVSQGSLLGRLAPRADVYIPTLWENIEGVNFLTPKSFTSTADSRYFGKKMRYSQIFEYFEQILHISNFHGPKESCAVELCLLYENCTE